MFQGQWTVIGDFGVLDECGRTIRLRWRDLIHKACYCFAGSTQCTGLAAIKMTALGRPQLLVS